MPTVKEHLNKPVISMTDGKKLGKIKDLYLDPKVTTVTAVSLGASGTLRHKQLMIDRAKVQTCGMDAWLVSGADVVVGPEHVVGSREFVRASELRGRQIRSEGGTEIATVDDIILDSQCNVKGFTLSKIQASGPLAQRKAIALGAFTSLGSKKNPMVTTLARAESMEIGVSVGTGPSTGTGT
jgi:uncharacterized protein YrrD